MHPVGVRPHPILLLGQCGTPASIALHANPRALLLVTPLCRPLDTNSSLNPAFANFNHVIFWYCDGGSFSGNAVEPQVVNGEKVWYESIVVTLT